MAGSPGFAGAFDGQLHLVPLPRLAFPFVGCDLPEMRCKVAAVALDDRPSPSEWALGRVGVGSLPAVWALHLNERQASASLAASIAKAGIFITRQTCRLCGSPRVLLDAAGSVQLGFQVLGVFLKRGIMLVREPCLLFIGIPLIWVPLQEQLISPCPQFGNGDHSGADDPEPLKRTFALRIRVLGVGQLLRPFCCFS